MPPFIQGRLSAFIAIAACLVLLLLSKIFTESDVSVNTQATFGDRAAAPAALAKREVEAPATIVAVPFGNKAGLQLSPPKAKSFLPSSNVKRDDVNVLWLVLPAEDSPPGDLLHKFTLFMSRLDLWEKTSH